MKSQDPKMLREDYQALFQPLLIIVPFVIHPHHHRFLHVPYDRVKSGVRLFLVAFTLALLPSPHREHAIERRGRIKIATSEQETRWRDNAEMTKITLYNLTVLFFHILLPILIKNLDFRYRFYVFIQRFRNIPLSRVNDFLLD